MRGAKARADADAASCTGCGSAARTSQGKQSASRPRRAAVSTRASGRSPREVKAASAAVARAERSYAWAG